MKECKVVITKGLPASGKTTWAVDTVKNGQGKWKRVNKDDLRLMVDCGVWSKEREKLILKVRDNIILTAILEGYNIIVDDTNLAPKHEAHIRTFIQEFVNRNNAVGAQFESFEPIQVTVEVKEFPITLDEAIRRDARRGEKSVGSEVIFRMHEQFIRPNMQLSSNPALPHVIICDLDGTLALHNGRNPFDYASCDKDLVNPAVLNVLKKRNFDTGLIFMSGRKNSCKEKTVGWLTEKCGIVPSDYQLYMRELTDDRTDYIVKKEMFDAHVKDKHYVELVLDDRNQVVTLWRDLGLTCFQVAEGYF